MKNWTTRFAVFAVLGAILSSAMLVGCGGKTEDENTAPAANKPAADAE